jgi:ATP-dependent Clp protease protease subunit
MSTRILVALFFVSFIGGLVLLSQAFSGPTKQLEQVANTSKPRTISLTADNSVFLTTEVNGDSSQAVVNDISISNKRNTNDPIYLLIDSPGGEVVSGSQIISAIEASHRPVYTVCLNLCASMAAMIHSYGHKRLSVDRSILMFHNASGGVQGEVPRMLSVLSTLSRFVEKMDDNVVSRSKLSKEHFMQLVQNELWIDARDSLGFGLTDEIVFVDMTDVKAANSFRNKTNNNTIKPDSTKFNINL